MPGPPRVDCSTRPVGLLRSSATANPRPSPTPTARGIRRVGRPRNRGMPRVDRRPSPVSEPAPGEVTAGGVFHIEMLPARNGDALWIEYGDPEAAKRGVIE